MNELLLAITVLSVLVTFVLLIVLGSTIGRLTDRIVKEEEIRSLADERQEIGIIVGAILEGYVDDKAEDSGISTFEKEGIFNSVIVLDGGVVEELTGYGETEAESLINLYQCLKEGQRD